MSRPVMAGLDGSRESVSAAHWAARESGRRGLPLLLVHVREGHPSAQEPLMGETDSPASWGERVTRDVAADVRQRHPELEITTGQLAGPPAEALSAAADQAELLVIGSRGLSGVAGFFVGSVAQATVAHARRPVVLVRAGESPEDEHLPDPAGVASTRTPYRDVVLGLDLTRPCDELLEFAFNAAAQRGARLRVVNGWRLPAAYGYAYSPGVLDPDLDAELAATEKDALSEALRPWRDKFSGVEVIEQSVIGRPAQHLMEAASDSSLVVIGRRTRHATGGTHLGPVAHAVIHHCDAPVAVVPHEG